MQLGRTARWWLPLIVAMCAGAPANGQGIQVPTAQLESSSGEVRIKAFYELVAAATASASAADRSALPPTSFLAGAARRNPEISAALIRLLDRENIRVSEAPSGSLGEDYLGGYYPDLAVTVARMNDPRAAKSLLPAIPLGDVVNTGVAAGGEAVVPAVIAILRNGSEIQAASAAMILGKIATGAAPLHADVSDAIKTALMTGVNENDRPGVRWAAARALLSFSGEDIRAAMTRLAELSGTSDAYRLRNVAQAWLTQHPDRP
jgi:hypothetical protein